MVLSQGKVGHTWDRAQVDSELASVAFSLFIKHAPSSSKLGLRLQALQGGGENHV